MARSGPGVLDVARDLGVDPEEDVHVRRGRVRRLGIPGPRRANEDRPHQLRDPGRLLPQPRLGDTPSFTRRDHDAPRASVHTPRPTKPHPCKFCVVKPNPTATIARGTARPIERVPLRACTAEVATNSGVGVELDRIRRLPASLERIVTLVAVSLVNHHNLPRGVVGADAGRDQRDARWAEEGDR